MSAHEEPPNAASESNTAERIDKTVTEFSPDLTQEGVKVDLGPLYAQIMALTQTFSKLVQDNSARTNPTIGPTVVDFRPSLDLQMGPALPKPYH